MPASLPNLPSEIKWYQLSDVPNATWVCGYCSHQVAEDKGYLANGPGGKKVLFLRACTNCHLPTVFTQDGKWHHPISPPGREVAGVPDDLAKLYDEARRSAGVGAYSAAVMVCRVILMHMAVEKGAKKRETFEHYVQFLADRHYVPPEGKDLADYIRTLGRDANHKIRLMDLDDADAAITFVGTLLQFIYELPGRLPEKAHKVLQEARDAGDGDEDQ